MADLRWWRQETPFGEVTVVVSDAGVVAVGLPGGDGIDALLDSALPERDESVAAALGDWMAGHSHRMDLPVDLDATGITGFRRTVLETLNREVGWGETVSYGELAAMSGRPKAARAVGAAMSTNPVPFVIPCHRVIAAGGRIGGYGGAWSDGGGTELKRRLLAREGVTTKD
ncbi:MAG: methylated-DNA--[protein]-cysteine S-methyltransferase [Acidimicrobiia bacterium]|nr:methylated-DNA--[protein]-cysteine S-methyltransferase [Acidimicrobiia bacterium]